ncbi:MAG: metal ABC transporter substrate-binding protein [Alphaproteobacteria bacterium]
MKNHIMIAIMGLLLVAPFHAKADTKDKMNLFACEPEWAALAEKIGGDRLESFTATTARQDPHHIRAKPSLIAAMRRADLVLCSGASLEIGWLPILLEKSGNANMQPGGKGYIMAADYVPMLEKPIRLDRADGDVHPEGNPHIQMNPHNIALVAKELTKNLQAIDPKNTAYYQQRFDDFSHEWGNAIIKWEKDAESLKGMKLVVHHKSFSYLLDWLQIKELTSLESKPGIPPSSGHLESVLQKLKTDSAKLIIRTPYEPEDASKWLSTKTGIEAVVLPYTVGGDAQATDLFSLFNRTIELLKKAKNDQ